MYTLAVRGSEDLATYLPLIDGPSGSWSIIPALFAISLSLYFSVTVPPMGISPLGSPITVSFQAKDFYSNTISAEWGNESFDAWSFNSIDNISAAHVYDKNNGSFQVLSNPLDNTDTTFLFVERNGLGIPGSPFEVITHISAG